MLAFIRRNEVMYGLTAQSYALVGLLIEEVLKVRWVQRFLSKAFEDTTLDPWSILPLTSMRRPAYQPF